MSVLSFLFLVRFNIGSNNFSIYAEQTTLLVLPFWFFMFNGIYLSMINIEVRFNRNSFVLGFFFYSQLLYCRLQSVNDWRLDNSFAPPPIYASLSKYFPPEQKHLLNILCFEIDSSFRNVPRESLLLLVVSAMKPTTWVSFHFFSVYFSMVCDYIN